MRRTLAATPFDVFAVFFRAFTPFTMANADTSPASLNCAPRMFAPCNSAMSSAFTESLSISSAPRVRVTSTNANGRGFSTIFHVG
ncbi:hypothetical protein PF005_g21520 [Phytophthora fragariae]|uniref:Uncharacterized protein n=1 Tax=Phytophthora fragariae TaxID=53985 RepID=A0A6A4CB60_9STRA|nr:hypothetical protein PF003_g35980 [Phytophthora fragariae]KAE8926977.1 hypothetical protein PF009_g22845 [Phytophthora fragariae]KAE9083245.1 hypothetical protein PF007_g21978 [Phytophthora fragariae]KAE9108050.1 hypothetical protein PF006_g20963 [Phytophthora fragariae]KAE9184828.1 hypothetical protein PF005_g21520 [Phytophthora fragariae]